ncbi:MAG: hypothetical protein QM692_07530 [Thermomicrobiales bacterium]
MRLFVAGVADGGEEVVGGGDAVGTIDDVAVFADDEDGAVDAAAVDAGLSGNRFQRAVDTRELEIGIDQQIEGQLEVRPEALVAVEVVCADAEWNGIEISISVDCPANRGQLVRSARGEIFRIEDQEDAIGAEIVGEGDRCAAGALQREIDRWIPDLWSWWRLLGHARIVGECRARVQMGS